MVSTHKTLAAFSLLLLSQASLVWAEPSSEAHSNTFALINGQSISNSDYLSALNEGMRKRFYHGSAPAAQVESFKQELTDELINNMLLLQEAQRRNIQADSHEVEQQLSKYEQRYASSEQWQQRKEKLLPVLRRELEEKSILSRIEQELKQVTEANEEEIKKYYLENQEKFTMPERRKISLILLKVEPSASHTVWKSAQDEAQVLINQIKAGEEFAELARIHSGDSQSANKGGDMGYLHKGMLAREAEDAIDKLSPGEISTPITMLQGVAVIRLEDISKPSVSPYEKVRTRARDLLMRERSEQQYRAVLSKLRSTANIQMFDHAK